MREWILNSCFLGVRKLDGVILFYLFQLTAFKSDAVAI